MATGCPHLQSKYAIFSVGHQRIKDTSFLFGLSYTEFKFIAELTTRSHISTV